MRRGEQGGAAVHVLGAALTVLLVVGGLGLAESVRAVLVRTRATQSLTAALQSAAQAGPVNRAGAERIFREVLRANLGDQPYTARFVALPRGGSDPLTGRRLPGPAVAGALELEYRLEYLARWLPAVRLKIARAEAAPTVVNRIPGS